MPRPAKPVEQSSSAVKRPNMKERFTDQQIIDLMKCQDDPIYFISKFMKVQHPLKGSIPFHPYKYQTRLIESFNKHRFVVSLLSRQMGKTTAASGFLLWKAMFEADVTILITANTYIQALEIMERVKYAYENLPDHLRPGVLEYNKGSVKFDNGSRIVSRATTPNAGRGLSISLLYVDEFSSLTPRLASDFWTSIRPTLSTGGSCIITSTPQSDEDKFAEIWRGALDNTDEFGNLRANGVGSNEFFPFLATWNEHPDRDEAWAETERASLGEAKFRQEHQCEFVSSDETLISSLTLIRLKGKEPIYYTGTVRWYSEPMPNRQYLIGLDPSLGTGGDDAAIQVFQLPEMVQIAEWQNNTTAPRNQVRILMQTLIHIDEVLRSSDNQAGDPEIFWTVENNTLGEAILQIIEDTGEDRFPGTLISERRRRGSSRRFRKGMNTTPANKRSACARLKSLVETGRLIPRSSNLIRQFKHFVARENSFAAKQGEKDDLVSATLLIARMLDVVLHWASENSALKERIDDLELEESSDDFAMPLVF